MKKFLGVILLSLVVLTACGGDDNGGSGTETVVCHLEEMGVDTETTIYVEDGYAVRSVTVAREYAEGATEDDLEFLRSILEDGMEVELDGDYIIVTYSIDFEEDLGEEPQPIDELIEELETFRGFDCE